MVWDAMKEDQEKTPLRTILQNFLNHIENLESQRDSKDSYESEFQDLKLFSESLKHEEEYSCSEGEKDINRKKNRYKDILPFNISRVVLSEYAGVRGSDYINANFIKGASGSLAYIASQGPLPNTVNDFWRMVVQCEVQVIVMACNEEESGKHKCENYWVESDSEEKQYGMVSIRLLKASTVCPDFSVRTMKLMYTNPQSQKEERTVCQFHYCAWPDHGVPPLVRPLLDMVRLVRDTQASETLPVLIHCSAGCGRTGTICAIDYVWGLLRAGKLTKDFSLFALVRNMRKQRIAMVQTKEQYVLVHQAVRELFREQLKMIDSHPYENIDCNGMPLIKEIDPIYDTVGIPQQINTEEKKDDKEKSSTESLIQAPPLPSKKKIIHVASKEEKEVENLSEKQRLVERGDSSCESVGSSGGSNASSHKLKIAKLKSMFERSSGRESRRNASKQSEISRSHSVGAVRKTPASSEADKKPPTPEQKPQVKPARLNLNQDKATPSPPQNSRTAKSVKSSKSKLVSQIKRSKSMKVIGSDARKGLSVMPSENSIAKQNVCDNNNPGQRLIPSDSEMNPMRERRLSLESIVDEIKECSRKSSQNHQPIPRTDLLLDEQTRKFLQDCRQYLFGADKGAKNNMKLAVAASGFKERRNSFCQAVNKQPAENPKAKEYETIWQDAPKKPALVRSYTAIDMRASSNRTPIKYTAHMVDPKLSAPPKPVSNHKHNHHHSSEPSKSSQAKSQQNSNQAKSQQNSNQFLPADKMNLTPSRPVAPSNSQNIPLYQNLQFLGVKNIPIPHSSQILNPQSQNIYSSVPCKPKQPSKVSSADETVHKNKSSQQLHPPSRTSIPSELILLSGLPKEAVSIPTLHPAIKGRTNSQEVISVSEPQSDATKRLQKESKGVKHSYISNTFPLQASKSASSGYSSSSSMERTVRQPKVNADFRKSDPIIQNCLLSSNLMSKTSSQGSTPLKQDQEMSAKPYLIPSIGPRLIQSPNLRPNVAVLKHRPPFPPPYQTACASSANYSELCNYDILRTNRGANPMKANVLTSVLPNTHYHSNSNSNSKNPSSNNSNNVRTPASKTSNISNPRALPPDHRYSDVPGCSQITPSHPQQNSPAPETPKTSHTAPSNWMPQQSPGPAQGLGSVGTEDVTPKTSRIKHSHSSSLKNNPDIPGVRMRHGSRDDLALCGSGSNPPNRVKRHASVVLSRYSLIDTNDHASPQIANWNSSQVNGFARSPTTNYHHHHHPPPQQSKMKEYENWSEAPGIDLDKVAATLSEKESDSSQFMRKTLEGLHIRKRIPSNSPGSHEASTSNSKPLGAQQQSNPPVSFKKQQQYL